MSYLVIELIPLLMNRPPEYKAWREICCNFIWNKYYVFDCFSFKPWLKSALYKCSITCYKEIELLIQYYHNCYWYKIMLWQYCVETSIAAPLNTGGLWAFFLILHSLFMITWFEFYYNKQLSLFSIKGTILLCIFTGWQFANCVDILA